MPEDLIDSPSGHHVAGEEQLHHRVQRSAAWAPHRACYPRAGAAGAGGPGPGEQGSHPRSTRPLGGGARGFEEVVARVGDAPEPGVIEAVSAARGLIAGIERWRKGSLSESEHYSPRQTRPP